MGPLKRNFTLDNICESAALYRFQQDVKNERHYLQGTLSVFSLQIGAIWQSLNIMEICHNGI